MRSPTYPAGRNGAVLEGINPQAGHYGAEDPFDCDVSIFVNPAFDEYAINNRK